MVSYVRSNSESEQTEEWASSGRSPFSQLINAARVEGVPALELLGLQARPGLKGTGRASDRIARILFRSKFCQNSVRSQENLSAFIRNSEIWSMLTFSGTLSEIPRIFIRIAAKFDEKCLKNLISFFAES